MLLLLSILKIFILDFALLRMEAAKINYQSFVFWHYAEKLLFYYFIDCYID